MSKLVMRIAEFKNKPVLSIVICVAWSALLIIAVRLGIEDYTTSVLGYQAIPTRKADQYIAYLVGALPMLLQVAFGFWAIEKNNRLAVLITIAAFLVDVSTDVYYKAVDQTIAMYVLAAIESVVLFTLGTEFLFLVALENIAEYLPIAITGVFVIFGKIGTVFSVALSWLVGSKTKSDRKQSQRRDYEEYR